MRKSKKHPTQKKDEKKILTNPSLFRPLPWLPVSYRHFPIYHVPIAFFLFLIST